ncbi:MAG: hypothetical protein ABFR33_10260, partial [Verrucomicrobiota bacterium]
MKKIAVVMTAMAAVAAQADVLISEDFNTRAVTPFFESIPDAATIGAYEVDTSASYLSVVEGGSGASPGSNIFGSDPNRYLRVADYSDTDDGTKAWWRIADSEDYATEGVMSMDFYVVDYETGALWMKAEHWGGTDAVAIRHYNGTLATYTSSGYFAFDNACAEGAAHSLVINFDVATQKFTGTLDGAALTSGGGTITEFDFRNLVGGVHGVQV